MSENPTKEESIAALRAENSRLLEANGILKGALLETCKEFPNSAAERWIHEQISRAENAVTLVSGGEWI